MSNKVFQSAADALQDIVKDGQTFAVGGFGLCGIPEALIATLKETGQTTHLYFQQCGCRWLWFRTFTGNQTD
jgi:acyl CoA:acetate/3-ketoacid CoA transferase alpha subunit